MAQFPRLCILPIESLLLHEHHDHQRTLPLIERFSAEGVLRNPPAVAPFEDHSARFVILDGANRTTALRALGFSHTLAQVVEQNNAGLCLKTWSHVLFDLDVSTFLDDLRKIPGLIVQLTKQEGAPIFENDNILAWMLLPGGENYRLASSSIHLGRRIDLLNAIERKYREQARIERASLNAIESLDPPHFDLSALVVFPPFKIEEIYTLVKAGRRLPAGITHFIISPRALRVNYPLSELMDDRPLEAKNIALQEWLLARQANRGIRYYEESTYVFDE